MRLIESGRYFELNFVILDCLFYNLEGLPDLGDPFSLFKQWITQQFTVHQFKHAENQTMLLPDESREEHANRQKDWYDNA